MAKWIFSFVVLASFTAVARPSSDDIKKVLEAQPACQNFVRIGENNAYLGFGPYLLGVEDPRKPIPSKFRVAPLDGSKPIELPSRDSSIDVVEDGSIAYVLTYSAIEVWDLSQRKRLKYLHTSNQEPLQFKQHPRGMIRYGDKLFLAHGRLGVTVVDLKQEKVTNEIPLVPSQAPLESQATSIALQGKYAFVVMDGFTLPNPGEPDKTFHGLVKIDLDTERVVSELPGLDPGADAIAADSQKLIVSYMGMPIWKYTETKITSSKLPNPDLRLWQFPIKGHPTGSASIDDVNYYTCFSRLPLPTEPQGQMVRVPMALDRKASKLD